MRCDYCGSGRVISDRGEFVCIDCGTVLGYEVMASPSYDTLKIYRKIENKILIKLDNIDKNNVKILYRDLLLKYLDMLDKEFKTNYKNDALKLIEKIKKSVYQSKTPKIMAATLYYIVADMHGNFIDKSKIAGVLKISKHSIRDTMCKIKKYVY